ncbi:hypothetical protein TYRP_005531 [Tyrophagus putrescentiae]|nr:hypothetical protein TYRP_005531 [Tyrophagus putrescentiae]
MNHEVREHQSYELSNREHHGDKQTVVKTTLYFVSFNCPSSAKRATVFEPHNSPVTVEAMVGVKTQMEFLHTWKNLRKAQLIKVSVLKGFLEIKLKEQ